MRKIAFAFFALVFALTLFPAPAEAGRIANFEIGDWLKRNLAPVDLEFSSSPAGRAHPPFTYDGEYFHLIPPASAPSDVEKLFHIWAPPIRPRGLDLLTFSNGSLAESPVSEISTFLYVLTGAALIGAARILGGSRRG
jgi:hypothetical protein